MYAGLDAPEIDFAVQQPLLEVRLRNVSIVCSSILQQELPGGLPVAITSAVKPLIVTSPADFFYALVCEPPVSCACLQNSLVCKPLSPFQA